MIRLEPRPEVSKGLLYVTPVIAIAVTILAGVVMLRFSARTRSGRSR